MSYQCDRLYEEARRAKHAKVAIKLALREHGKLLGWLDTAREKTSLEVARAITAIYDAVEASMDGYEDVMDLLDEKIKDGLAHAADTDPFERHNI